MLFKLIQILRRRFLGEAADALPAEVAYSKSRDLRLPLDQSGEIGWWIGLTSAVGNTDEELAVIRPGSETAEGLKALGAELERWKSENSYVRHIYGLQDLLEGRPPRTPPLYLGMPYPVDGFEHCYEPIVLAFVAARTNHNLALEELSRALEKHGEPLAWFSDAETYSRCQR